MACQLNHSHSLDARHLTPIVYLQNARIVLHRHNMSSMCPPEIRSAAVGACVNVAKDTIHFLSRAMLPQAHSWQKSLASAASAMLCTHIWRCMLLLCLRGYWNDALVCVKACTAIGDTREVNMWCGRNIYGFLKTLGDKLSNGEDVERDEGLLALASGDVQGSTESSWVWAGSETGPELDAQEKTVNSESITTDGGGDTNMTTNDDNMDDWGGWDRIEWMVNRLMNEQAARDLQSIGAASVNHSVQRQFQPTEPQPSAASRISIANII